MSKFPIVSSWLDDRVRRKQHALYEQQSTEKIHCYEADALSILATYGSCISTVLLEDGRGVIVSLTTYGPRIHTVHLTLLSLLTQDHPINGIVLWLAEDEFTLDDLPQTVTDLTRYGLEIKFCRDLRSYKKLIPSLKQYPDKVIITVDDDVIYPKDQVRRLIAGYRQFPDTVICHRAHQIVKDSNGKVLPYKQWHFDISISEPQISLFPVGIGGVLYPPGCLAEEVIDEALFMKICPTADDIWFKIMAIKSGTRTKVVDNPIAYEDYWQIIDQEPLSLWQQNRELNDAQLSAVLSHFHDIQL